MFAALSMISIAMRTAIAFRLAITPKRPMQNEAEAK
jgi:hypothetical protein